MLLSTWNLALRAQCRVRQRPNFSTRETLGHDCSEVIKIWLTLKPSDRAVVGTSSRGYCPGFGVSVWELGPPGQPGTP